MRTAALLAMGCAFGVGACSLLVDTSGFSSSSSEVLPNEPSPGGEGGTDGAPGCDANLDTVENCCGVACAVRANGAPACELGHCKTVCAKGFGDCDGDETNGCETKLDADPANCGACKRDCGGGSCAENSCGVVLLASSQAGPGGIAVDATNVYWANTGDGKLNKCPLAGCGPSGPTTIATSANTAYVVAVDATSVYWNSYASSGRIYSCPLGGCGSPTTIANTPFPGFLTLDDAAVYWTNGNGDLRKVKKDGSSPLTLSAATTADAGAGAPGGLALADDVYFVATGGSAIYKCAATGCPGGATLLVGSQTGALAIAVDATHVYWTTSTEIKKAPRAGGAAVTLATGQQNATSLVLSDTNVYWSNDIVAGSISVVSKSGGAVKVVAPHQSAPVRLVMHAEWLYWANFGSGSIMKIRRDLQP